MRAHVFLCMLAYYVDWHMRAALAPILFQEDDPEAAEAQRDDVVSKAQKSPSAQRKASTKRTEDDLQVQSFPDLLRHLATIVVNEHRPTLKGIADQTFFTVTELNPLQTRAFELLGLRPNL